MTVGYTQLNAHTTSGDKMETSVSADPLVKTQHAVACALVAGVPTGVSIAAPMPVDPRPVVVVKDITPTISNGAAYASGDVIGGLQTITTAARIAGGSGTIVDLIVVDKTQAQRSAMDIVLFDRSVTVAADNSPFACSDADMLFCLGVFSIGAYNTAWPGTPLNSISTSVLLNKIFSLAASSGTSLFFAIVARGTPTYGSTSDLQFKFIIQQD